jgi:hypothetical protein
MNERYAEWQKAKGKSKDAKPDGGGNSSPKKRSSGGSSERVPKMACSKKFCQRCKTHGGPHQMHNTNDCRKYDKDGKPLGATPGKPSDSIRANEIAIENSKTGKVTAVVAVIYLCRDKLCNLWSAKREP